MRLACLLPLACVVTVAACSRPASSTDCPPATTEGEAEPSAQAEAPAEAEDDATAEAKAAEATIPAAPEALTITADDGHELRLWRLASDAPADGDAPAILLLHGRTWSSLPDFDLRVDGDPSLSLMHALAARGRVAYALDLRGYGQSERDATGWLEPERAAEDLSAALAEVQGREGEAPDLLGWSMGAALAHLAVQDHPEAVRKLVLYGYPRDVDARLPEPKAPPDDAPPRKPNTKAAAASDFITEGTISDAAIATYVEAALAADPVRVDWRGLHQYNALEAEALRVPTLIIHGAHDPIAKQLWQAKLFTRMAVDDRQWVIVPEADHAAHLEQPEDFLRALLAFLDG